MSNFQRTAEWLQACGKKSDKYNLDAISVQIGCHLEEICELLEVLYIDDEYYLNVLRRTVIDLDAFALRLKQRSLMAYIPEHLRPEALDALCDAEVTGNGIAHLAGMRKDAADDAVLNANAAKLVDGKPVIMPGGKIGKPEGWKAPDLSQFV